MLKWVAATAASNSHSWSCRLIPAFPVCANDHFSNDQGIEAGYYTYRVIRACSLTSLTAQHTVAGRQLGV